MKLKFPLILIFIVTLTSCTTNEIANEEMLFSEDVTTQTEANTSISDFEKEIHDQVNQHRIAMGLSELAFGTEAYPFAGEHNEYMIAKGKLSHDNFSQRASKISKESNAIAVAENVAKNYGSAAEVLENWLASDSHKNTIEGDFTHSAIAVGEDGDGNPYFTHIFFKK